MTVTCNTAVVTVLTFSQDTSRRYENKAGAFITGIDVTSKVSLSHSFSTWKNNKLSYFLLDS